MRGTTFGTRMLATASVGLLVCGAAATAIGEPQYYAGTGHYYEVSEYKWDWEGARYFAELQTHMGLPGHMATITSEGENAFVANLVWSHWDRHDQFYWLGAHLCYGKGPGGGSKYCWITGERWSYENWLLGWPDESSCGYLVGFMADSGPSWPTGGWLNPPIVADLDYVVEYEPRPRLYGVYVGSDHWDLGIPKIRGKADADAVEAKFWEFGMCEGSSTLHFDYKERGDGSRSSVFNALAGYESSVHEGDVFVFFYAGHGGGSSGQDEWLAINRDQPGDSDDWERKITDDELAAWFLSDEQVGSRTRREIWDEVNKLFILDTCHSGGFGSGDDGVYETDLMGLSHAAILAACGEDALALSRWDGRGRFTLAVEDALVLVNGYARADSNRDGLTFEELEAYLTAYIADSAGFDGYIRLDPAGDDLQLVAGELSLYSWASADYQGVIPEPATLALLAVGGLGLLARRRK